MALALALALALVAVLGLGLGFKDNICGLGLVGEKQKEVQSNWIIQHCLRLNTSKLRNMRFISRITDVSTMCKCQFSKMYYLIVNYSWIFFLQRLRPWFGLEGGVLGFGLGSCGLGLGLEVCVLGLALALGVMSLLTSLFFVRPSHSYSTNAATKWRNVRGGHQQADNVIGSVPDEHLVHKQAQLVLYSLCDRQPMQLLQSRSDMVAKLSVQNSTCSCMQDSL